MLVRDAKIVGMVDTPELAAEIVAAMNGAQMCVCNHPRSAHDGSKCMIALCACGPGCIHDGFVAADGSVDPTLPKPVPRGHCGRCDRCELPKSQCIGHFGDSYKPPRTHCAGCGAPYKVSP